MKLSIYYHIWAPHDEPLVRLLIDEQIKRLELHSLTNQATVNVVVVGEAAQQIANYVNKVYGIKVRKVVTQEDGWELHTLKVLHDDCLFDKDQYVMYMHTKGMQHYYGSVKNTSALSNVNTWRKFMEYVCIDQWRECINDLIECDAVGMNLYKTPFVHFSGNFWWATGEHIAKLKEPFTDANVNPSPSTPGVQCRHQAEAWVGSTNGRFKTRLQIPGSMYSTQKFNQYKIVTSE